MWIFLLVYLASSGPNRLERHNIARAEILARHTAVIDSTQANINRYWLKRLEESK